MLDRFAVLAPHDGSALAGAVRRVRVAFLTARSRLQHCHADDLAGLTRIARPDRDRRMPPPAW